MHSVPLPAAPVLFCPSCGDRSVVALTIVDLGFDGDTTFDAYRCWNAWFCGYMFRAVLDHVPFATSGAGERSVPAPKTREQGI